MRIPITTARRLAVSAQGLDGRWRLPRGKEGAAQAIERLGYVQIDTIAVVQRAHHHTIWSRRPDYRPEMLHELQATDRRVFEYWTHAASYLPMRDYRYFARRMRAFAGSPRTRGWMEANAELVGNVLGRIRSEGALGSADFAAPEGLKRGPWWDWKPAKRALEMLFSAGTLMVAERRNFQRLYDLAERVLPPGCDTAEPDERDAALFAVRRDLAAHGVASPADLGRGICGPSAVSQALVELTESGDVTPVAIEGIEDETHYALTGALEQTARRAVRQPPVHVVSPFDSLVIRRWRVAKLFGFDYKLECYLPAPQRRHGYFCLPILRGDRFIGRLDPKADRETGTLFVRSAVFERGFDEYDEMLPGLAGRLRAFARFNACDRVVVEQTSPRKARIPLIRCLRDAGIM